VDNVAEKLKRRSETPHEVLKAEGFDGGRRLGLCSIQGRPFRGFEDWRRLFDAFCVVSLLSMLESHNCTKNSLPYSNHAQSHHFLVSLSWSTRTHHRSTDSLFCPTTLKARDGSVNFGLNFKGVGTLTLINTVINLYKSKGTYGK